MKKLCPREAVFVGLLVIVPLLMFVLVVKPRHDTQKKMSQTATNINTTCGEFGDIRLSAIKSLKNDKKALYELVEDTRKRLPKEGDSGGILHGLARMARENNLILKHVEPVNRGPEQSTTNNPKYGTQWIDIKLEGSFEGLYDFLIAMEGYERIILIDKMNLKLTKSMSGNGDETGAVRINAELGLVVYFQKVSENEEEAAND